MDITASFITTNPLYDPLPPSVDNLLTYSEELDYECPHITYEWALHEIENHLLNWVRVGLVAAKVRLYRLYQRHFRTFQEFCSQKLGYTTWRINRIIKAALVVKELAEKGFKILPKCEAQASCLVKYEGEELCQKWQQVIDALPAHRITAMAIDDELGHERKKRERIPLSSKIAKRLRQRALQAGMSVEEFLEQILDDEDSEEDELITHVNPKAIECWKCDLHQLVEEHDTQIWLLTTILRWCDRFT